MLQKFFVSPSRSVPWNNPVSEVCRQFLGLHVLVFALTCCWTLNRLVCISWNHVQTTEYTTGGIQSNCRNIWHVNYVRYGFLAFFSPQDQLWPWAPTVKVKVKCLAILSTHVPQGLMYHCQVWRRLIKKRFLTILEFGLGPTFTRFSPKLYQLKLLLVSTVTQNMAVNKIRL